MHKKICSITTISSTLETFVLPSMVYMEEKGWDVTFISHEVNNFSKRLPQGMHFYNAPMERNFSIIKAFKTLSIIYKACKRDEYSIIQYGTTHAALFGSIAAWFARVPIRIHLQWGIYEYSKMPFITRIIYKGVEKITCRLSTDIRPVSRKNLQVAIDERLFKPGKGKVLGEGGTIGIDFNNYKIEEKENYKLSIRKKYNIPQDAFVYGFIGRLSKDKGNNELLYAFKSLSQKTDNTYLVLIGNIENGIDPQLFCWAKENDRVIFTDQVKHEDIPIYVSALNVLVHPTYREGFGMVLQEAMAMEVPIITTNIPGPSEVIEDGISGVLVPAKDSEALKQKMFELYSNKELSITYGKNGRIRAKKYFNRPVMIENIYIDKEELYNKLINKI